MNIITKVLNTNICILQIGNDISKKLLQQSFHYFTVLISIFQSAQVLKASLVLNTKIKKDKFDHSSANLRQLTIILHRAYSI